MEFVSPTNGSMTMEEMLKDLDQFILAGPHEKFKLIIGTDSQPGNSYARPGKIAKKTCFVTAVIIHKEGKGARYYYRKVYHHPFQSLKQRIMDEVGMSLELALSLIDRMAINYPELAIEIHLDVGQKGKSREIVQQAVGMITTNGFAAMVKPFSFGASKVADRYTRS